MKILKKRKRRKFNRSGKFWVYVVECADGTYYTGYAGDLTKRLKEHNFSKRGAKYLRGKTPVKLIYAKKYRNYKNAMHAEMDIKKRTRREKEVMIEIYHKNMSPQISPLFASKSMRVDDTQRCEL